MNPERKVILETQCTRVIKCTQNSSLPWFFIETKEKNGMDEEYWKPTAFVSTTVSLHGGDMTDLVKTLVGVIDECAKGNGKLA